MRVTDHIHRLLSRVLVLLLTLVILLVDAGTNLHRLVFVLHNEQTDRLFGALNTPGSVDTRTDIEHQIRNGNNTSKESVLAERRIGSHLDAGLVEDGADAHTRNLVNHLQTEMRKNAVFTSDGHNVASNTHRDQIHALQPQFVGKLIAETVTLHQLETDTATGQLLIRIRTILALGIQNSHGVRQGIAFKVVVGDDDIYTVLVGQIHHVVSLDTAVE